jgi:hypothetical protein
MSLLSDCFDACTNNEKKLLGTPGALNKVGKGMYQGFSE